MNEVNVLAAHLLYISLLHMFKIFYLNKGHFFTHNGHLIFACSRLIEPHTTAEVGGISAHLQWLQR